MNLIKYNKTIGIYMPTRNRAQLLKKAVETVLNQSYKNFQLIIVDDGSSDDTIEFLDSIKDERVSYIQNSSPMGACYSRNQAINALNTELVTGLDDDDEFLPTRLHDLLSAYDEKYAFICSGYYWNYGVHKKALFTKSRVISLSDAFDLNQCSNQILVNRERILKIGGFDVSLPALQDHDLWVRLIAEYGAAYRIGKPLYTVNDDNSIERISSTTNKVKAISIFEIKHKDLMLKRNIENFLFYKMKVKGEAFTFLSFVRSIKFGLFKLKFKYFCSQYLKRLSKARLVYLRTGKSNNILHFLSTQKNRLLATAAIVILCCILISF